MSPITFEEKNGQVVTKGTALSKAAYVPLQPPATKPRPTPTKQKNWFEKTLNDIGYEIKRVQRDPAAAARTYVRNVAEAPQRAVQQAVTAPVRQLNQTLNHLRFESNQLANTATRAQRLGTYGANAALTVLANPATPNGQILRQGLPATATAGSNLARNLGGPVPEIGQYEDMMYRFAGEKPPSEMNQGELALAQTKASLLSNYALTMFGGGVLGRLAPNVAARLNPLTAPNLYQGLARGMVVEGLADTVATLFEDNTGGSAAGLADAVLGTTIDPVKPGMSYPEATAAAFVPNALFAVGTAGLGTGLGRLLPGHTQAIRGDRVTAERTRQRKTLEDAGLVDSNPETNQSAFTPQAVETPAAPPAASGSADPSGAAAAERPGAATVDEIRAANAQFEQQWGLNEPTADGVEPSGQAIPSQEMTPGGAVTDGKLPSADPDGNIWDAQYDPELPEADVGLDLLERLDDDELPIAVQADDPIATAADLIESRQPLTPEAISAGPGPELVRADAANLATPAASWRSQWQALPTAELQGMVARSPELTDRLERLTGKTFEEATKQDLLDAFDSAAAEGSVYLPSRMNPTETLIPTDAISVDPQRFQFKQGVDAQGQQRGNSLSGVGQWSVDAEGSIQVWDDPTDGNTYVVNGHNRVAKARELGIPSLKAQLLLAEDAVQARAAGAIANIASGGGTVFDAAKFFRDSGVTDPSALQAMGVPLSSGTGRAGVALAQLPDNIFQDAVDGRISQGKAIALGESGLDPDSMQQAYKALQSGDMTDGTWAEVLQQARSAPVVEGQQVDLFGNTETLNLMVQKGDLARRIRAEISGDKKLFGTVKRNANRLEAGGNQIDAAASGGIAAKAEALLTTFDTEKYAAGSPISELLNQGAQEVAAGAKPAVVAKRLKQQLVQSLDQVMAPPRRAPEPDDNSTDVGVAAEARWSQLSPDKQEARATEARGSLLTEKKLQNRLAFEEQYKANEAQVQQYLDDMPGSNSGVELTEEQFIAKYGPDENQHPKLEYTGSTQPKQLQELDAHRWAERYLDWFENRREAPALTPEQRQAMQVAGVQKAIVNGRVRPPATPIPDVPVVSSDLSRGLKDLLEDNPTPEALQLLDEEARLQQHYADLEAHANAAQVQEVRDAVGYEELTFDQKKAVGITEGYAPEAPGGLTTNTAITLDERALFARQQRLRAEGLGDEDAVTAWRTEERRLERERISAAQAAQDQTQGGLFGAGQYDTSTPLLNQPAAVAAAPAIEIPAGASRKITARTADARIQSAAESLVGWTTPPGGDALLTLDQALERVKAKGAILDPDKIPGLDMAAAREAGARRTGVTPEMEAVAAAYRQFYGLETPAPSAPSYGLLKPGTELSHGTTARSAQAIMQTGFRPSKVETGGAILGDGVYMTDSPMYAGAYGDTALFGPLPDDARILDLVGDGKSANDFAKEIGVGAAAEKFDGTDYFSDDQQRAIQKWATDNGYDGIRFDPVFDGSEVGAPEVVLYNLNTANRLIGSNVAVEPGSKLFPGFTPLPSPDAVPDFQMPADLAGSAPRYGRAEVQFASDLDRAAYILRDPSKKSAAEERLIQALVNEGYALAEIRKHGQAVNDAIKAEVKAKTGSAKAPQTPGTIAVADQGFAGAQLQRRLEGVTNEVVNLDKQMNQLRNKLNQEGC